MRDRARREGKGLSCLEVIDAEGNRQTYWGPAGPDQIRFVSEAILGLIKLNNEVARKRKPRRKA